MCCDRAAPASLRFRPHRCPVEASSPCARVSDLKRSLALPSLLLAATGAAALTYEIVWTRWLQLALGAGAASLAIVVASTMLGFAAGGEVGGGRAHRGGGRGGRWRRVELGGGGGRGRERAGRERAPPHGGRRRAGSPAAASTGSVRGAGPFGPADGAHGRHAAGAGRPRGPLGGWAARGRVAPVRGQHHRRGRG